jgi:hypothetical protein
VKYRFFNTPIQSSVVDLESNAFIPADPANTDYAEGNEPLPADE